MSEQNQHKAQECPCYAGNQLACPIHGPLSEPSSGAVEPPHSASDFPAPRRGSESGSNQHSERTPREILATGAAWVTESELQRLVETVEAAEWAMTSHAERARNLEEQLEAHRQALQWIADWPHVKLYGGHETAYMPLIVHERAAAALLGLRGTSFPAVSPESPCSICGTYGHFTHDHERETSSPASSRKPGRSSECGHSWWVSGCPVCDREKKDALAKQASAMCPVCNVDHLASNQESSQS